MVLGFSRAIRLSNDRRIREAGMERHHGYIELAVSHGFDELRPLSRLDGDIDAELGELCLRIDRQPFTIAVPIVVEERQLYTFPAGVARFGKQRRRTHRDRKAASQRSRRKPRSY